MKNDFSLKSRFFAFWPPKDQSFYKDYKGFERSGPESDIFMIFDPSPAGLAPCAPARALQWILEPSVAPCRQYIRAVSRSWMTARVFCITYLSRITCLEVSRVLFLTYNASKQSTGV